MIRAKFRVSGYRCFGKTFPVEINITNGFTSFIGPNNSGKTALLRFFHDFKPVFVSINNELSKESIVHGLREQSIHLNLHPLITDSYELVTNRQAPLTFEIEFFPHDEHIYVQKVLFTYNPEKQEVKFKTQLSNGGAGKAALGSHISKVYDFGDQKTREGLDANTKDICEVINALSRTLYIGPFRNAINEGGGNYYDLVIGTAFIDQWNNWKNGPSVAGTEAALRATEDIRRLLSLNQLEINSTPVLKTFNVIVNGRSRKLTELGSGLSQLIMVLGNAVMNKPSFILIDEPETHLHPSLQIDFLTALTSYAEFGVIYATHSLGLARSVSDQCYSVIPTINGSKVSLYEKTPNLAEFLGSMGIAGMQEIGFSKILCVEGPTDVRTYQQVLRKFDLERKVVIIPLGGDSLINGKSTNEFAELTRLGSGVSVIIDSEKKSAKESVAKGRKKFQDNCIKMGINCHILARRATENYLTDRAIKELYGNTFTALGAFELPSKEENKFWGKTENWRIAQLMTRDEFEDTDMGQFIKTIGGS